MSAYSARVTNWPLFGAVLLIGAVMIVAAYAMHPQQWGLAVAGVGVWLIALMFASVQVTVGASGVTARIGLGIPVVHVRLEEIESVEAVNLARRQVGGWGLHWTPWRKTRLVVRSGPTLVVHRRDASKLSISARDPQAAVAALESWRRAPTS